MPPPHSRICRCHPSRSRLSQVQWTDQATGSSFQALCGFDIGLLAGIGNFVSGGENYSIFMMHKDIDTTRPNRSKIPIQIPKALPGQILITQRESTSAVATAKLELIRDLIATEKERLSTYQSARQHYQQASTSWEKAHPSEPRDVTIVIRPHRGSRYLADPQPEKKEVSR